MPEKTAVVTGASSGIGKAVTLRLLKMGYRVIGISRHISKKSFEHEAFISLPCDLSQHNQLSALGKTLQEQKSISLLVNAAGFGRFEPHEELSLDTIYAMTAVNLTAPISLSNLLLRTLKANQGTIINITSIEALRASKFSALYTATKAGLRAFGTALFEEVRKSGVNVVTLNPDMTDTDFFTPLRFGVSHRNGSHLLSEDIADAIEQVLRMRSDVCVTEMTIRPQYFGITKK